MQRTSWFIKRRALPLRRQAHIVLVLALAALGILGVSWAASYFHSDSSGPADAPSDGADLRLSASQLAGLTIRPVNWMSFRSEEETDGRITLNSDTATQVFSPYSGRVIRVIAALGAHLRRGEPLFSIEASEFAQTQSDLLNALSQLKLARIGEERRHAAFDSKGGSLQDWQQAQADLAASQNALDSVRNRLRIFGETDAQIAVLEHARRPNPITNVVAPIDGVVTDRQVGPGEYLQAGGSTPVYTIGDLSTVWLVAEVREVDAPQIQIGQQAEVHVLAFPARLFTAKLTAVGASVNPVTRRVPVRAILQNPDGKLKPQMFATFNIITSGNSESLAVPEEAVIREGEAARVWVLEAGNELTLRPIRIGRISNGMIEVLEGLRAGERIVTRGSLFIDRAAEPG